MDKSMIKLDHKYMNLPLAHGTLVISTSFVNDVLSNCQSSSHKQKGVVLIHA